MYVLACEGSNPRVRVARAGKRVKWVSGRWVQTHSQGHQFPRCCLRKPKISWLRVFLGIKLRSNTHAVLLNGISKGHLFSQSSLWNGKGLMPLAILWKFYWMAGKDGPDLGLLREATCGSGGGTHWTTSIQARMTHSLTQVNGFTSWALVSPNLNQDNNAHLPSIWMS